jgi:hypothetical protein
MKKSHVIIISAIIVLMAFLPMASGRYLIDKNSTPTAYKTSVPTQATISASTGGGSGTTNENAPTAHYQFIMQDVDYNKECYQIEPIPSGTQTIVIYTILSDPQGRDNIQMAKFASYFPDDIPPWCGMFMNSTDGTVVTDSTTITNVLDYAEATHHIDKNTRNLIEYNLIAQPIWYMYCGVMDIEYCNPAGIYTMQCWGVDKQGNVGLPLDTPFEWLEYVAMEIDFEAGLDWGNVAPGSPKYIQGDNNMETPLAPTVKNEGNTKVIIQLAADNMINQVFEQYKIKDFDVQFMGITQTFTGHDPGEAIGTWTQLTEYLCLCNTKKIDLSIHPAANLPAGVYKGTLYIHISKAPWAVEGEPPCPQ